ncbi:hypothetical protein SAMN05660742_111119 [Propionispira arboris]|uniref:Uncharacterized protein n=1 Tax=Propionispira arboris TaxID=84035 RepID=A0A1H7A6V0_9FIRM|nr:hypothetical protein SAMN05660742_111119 [Propionispira arboris]
MKILLRKFIDHIVLILKKCIDAILLLLGMAFINIGVFLVNIPAGFISIGICFVLLAFIVAKKYAA